MDDSTLAVYLLRNDDGVFSVADDDLPPLYSGRSTWGDYDGDGDLDLLLMNGQSYHFVDDNVDLYVERLGFTRLLRNDGGTLVPSGLELPALVDGTVQWADYDNDGDLDIVLGGNLLLDPHEPSNGLDNPPFARIYENDGGGFTERVPFEPEDYDYLDLYSVVWADFDGDGWGDLLVSGDDQVDGNDGMTRIFLYDDGAFVDAGTASPAPRSGLDGDVAWADFDGDGDLDYLIRGMFASEGGRFEQHLYRNDAPATNAAPMAPTGLSAAVAGSDVTLAWEGAGDDHTPSAGLTYNLWVFERFGSDIVSPMSLPGGQRMLPAAGNVSHNTSWTLRGLPAGEYEWRVQAVDNAFNGGAFAEGGAFVLGSTGAEEGATPAVFAAHGVAPNPARSAATLGVDLPAAAPVGVALYDVLGREVLRTSVELGAGAGRAVGLDVSSLPSGVYVWRVEASLPGGVERASGRLTVVR